MKIEISVSGSKKDCIQKLQALLESYQLLPEAMRFVSMEEKLKESLEVYIETNIK